MSGINDDPLAAQRDQFLGRQREPWQWNNVMEAQRQRDLQAILNRHPASLGPRVPTTPAPDPRDALMAALATAVCALPDVPRETRRGIEDLAAQVRKNAKEVRGC